MLLIRVATITVLPQPDPAHHPAATTVGSNYILQLFNFPLSSMVMNFTPFASNA
ncbi:hypothetical protein MKK75_14150 [Methylobacterium sp. J-030]|uniref:hypothetical protein n=1 Tax=Methylobacterium sp. J-030 TaxID=2836627 RepID=UPI001FBBB793|nr:hypothetical protein [Methylobacterium sp. J-030]MCJ2069922.1 hypothetical protein [Methylobacterium sp. J-030]